MGRGPPRWPLLLALAAALDTVTGDRVYTFGDNADGELGDGGTTQSLLPALVPSGGALWGGGTVTAVAAGSGHTLIVAGGAVYAAGWNAYGQLGLGATATQVDTFAPTAAPWAPIPPSGISGGRWHTLFLVGGGVYACGWNNLGQLGVGAAVGQLLSPQRLNTTAVATAVAAGDQHSVLLATDGVPWTFGDNSLGQLGLGSAVTSSPVPRAVGVPSGAFVVAIAAGGSHTLLLAGTALYACGWNAYGQLGLGSSVAQFYTPQLVPISAATLPTAIAGGGQHTLVVSGGVLYTCGDNTYGQLGLGTNLTRVTTLQPLSAAPWPVGTVTGLAGGGYHSVVVAGSTVFAFGFNIYGALGLGNTQQYFTPRRLNGTSAPWSPGSPELVAAGNAFTVLSASPIPSPSPSPVTPSPSPVAPSPSPSPVTPSPSPVAPSPSPPPDPIVPPPNPTPAVTPINDPPSPGAASPSSGLPTPPSARPSPTPSLPILAEGAPGIPTGTTGASSSTPIVIGACVGGGLLLLLLGGSIAHAAVVRRRRWRRVKAHTVTSPHGPLLL